MCVKLTKNLKPHQKVENNIEDIALHSELHPVDEKGLPMGYVEPGHGYKGKQRWLCSDEDLHEPFIQARRKSLCGAFYRENGQSGHNQVINLVLHPKLLRAIVRNILRSRK